jgi:hypothetical protein
VQQWVVLLGNIESGAGHEQIIDTWAQDAGFGAGQGAFRRVKSSPLAKPAPPPFLAQYIQQCTLLPPLSMIIKHFWMHK